MSATLAYQVNGVPTTAAQFYAAACHPQRSVVVEACAGSGKTWMLVARIVRALLAGAAPHEVLAITFTNKAAAEMRTRLDAALLHLATCSADERERTLASYGLAADEAAQHAPAAAALLDQVLALPRQVEVRTFHGWFAQLVRSAPIAVLHSLGLPMGGELVEDDTPAMAATWRRLLQRVAGDAALKATYTALVQQVGRTKAQQALEAVWQRRLEFVRADATGGVDGAVAHFSTLPGFAGLALPTDALLTQRAQWLAWAAALGQQTGAAAPKAARAIEQAFTAGLAGESLLAVLTKALFTNEGERRKNMAKFEPAQAASDALDPVLAAQAQHEAWCFHQQVCQLARVWLDEYADFKRERGLIDMADLELAATRLLGDDATQAWMGERLDVQIRHLLVDEFQDTNPLQWQALHGWLSGYAGAGGGRPLSVFLVGDPKQSIYAFRRADPAVFAAATAFVQEAFGAAHLACDHTRRCAPEVTQAVNEVFEQAVAQGQYSGFRTHTTGRAQAMAAAEPTRTPTPAVARLPLVPKPEKAEKAERGWRDSLTEPKRELEQRSLQLEAAQAAQQVQHWLQQGLAPGDVLVLARKHEPLAAMAAELHALGIASAVREKALLADTLEVRDVLALLDVLVSPQHHLALAQALRSPLFGASDDDLMALALATKQAEPAGDWWQALLGRKWANHPALARAAGTLPTWAALVQSLPPHDALDAIYAQGDVLARYAGAVPAHLRGSVVGNLRQLLHEALQLDGGRFATAYGLVRALRGVNASSANGPGRVSPPPVVAPAWAEPQPDAGAEAAGAGQVRLLTVHGAKGLQAKAVLLLDSWPSARHESKPMALMHWPPEAPAPQRFAVVSGAKGVPPDVAPLWAAQQAVAARENLNLLYVAMTRAEDRLVFSAREPGRGPDPAAAWPRVQQLPEHAPNPPSPRPEAQHAQGNTVWWPMLPAWEPTVIGPADVAFGAPGEPLAANTRAAQMGQALHRLLEWATQAGVAPGVAAGALAPSHVAQAALEFGLTAGEALAVGQAAQAIAASPQAAPLLAPGLEAHNEVALTWQGKTLRIDRLVKSATGVWWVLDYKLGSDVQAVPAYAQQVRRYVQAVRALKPGEVVKGALINGQGELFEVSD